MDCVLAVDGGNSKTIALVSLLDGSIIGTGRSGCTDLYNAGLEDNGYPLRALAELDLAVTSALEMAQVAPQNLMAGVFGLAGADWPEDFSLLQTEMLRRSLGQKIVIQNDALNILHAGSGGHVGCSVICGTGAAIGARGHTDQVWHTSFWQVDADGSEDLARHVLQAVYLAELGIAPHTSLSERVMDFYRVSSVEAVLHRLTGRDNQLSAHEYLNGLASLLLDEAEAGDAVAHAMVQKNGYALGRYVNVAARKVGIEGTAFPLVLAGGVLRHPSHLLANSILEEVHKYSPAALPVRSHFEPVIGVLCTALEQAGVVVDAAVLDRISATLPDVILFETLPQAQM